MVIIIILLIDHNLSSRTTVNQKFKNKNNNNNSQFIPNIKGIVIIYKSNFIFLYKIDYFIKK